MKLIAVTQYNDEGEGAQDIWINPELVAGTRVEGPHTLICVIGVGNILVKEDIESLHKRLGA